jgi:zinc protease
LTKREFNEGIKAFLDSNEASLSMASNTANHDMAGWIAGWIVDGQPVNFTRELYVYRKSLAKSLSLEELNTDLARYILPSPAKMLVETIDKPGTQQPNADDLAAIKAQTLKAEVVAKPDRPLRLLVDHAPAKGQVVKIEAVAGTPFKLWTLSNGIRVYTYRNALTRGDFQFRAFAPGGLSEVSDADYQNARFGIYLLSRNGAGGLNQSELEDFLFGKMARVGFSLDEYEAGISGSCNPTDLDDMLAFFQLLYTRLTSLRRDAGAEKTALTDLSEDLANGESRPDKIYEREITRLMTDGSPRLASFTSERVKELDSDRAAAILPRFFANTANLSFVICGDFDEKNLKSLIETWLASLPNEVGASTGAIATNGVKDLGIRPSVGPQTSTVSAGHDDRAVVNLLMDTPYPYSAANRHLGDILREVLAIRMREVLRQDKGGTYTVGVRVDVEAQPYPHVRTRVTFTCSPQNKEALEKAATQELAAIAGGALGDNAFAKAVEILRRKAETDIKTNAYWVDNIHLALRNGEALASIPEWPAFYTGVKKADIATLAAAIIKPEAAIVVVLEPEAQP